VKVAVLKGGRSLERGVSLDSSLHRLLLDVEAMVLGRACGETAKKRQIRPTNPPFAGALERIT